MQNSSKNEFNDFSSLLADLVEGVQGHKKKEELEKILLQMDFLAEKIGGEVLKEFIKLKMLFIKIDKKNKEAFLSQCLKLKNELWEL